MLKRVDDYQLTKEVTVGQTRKWMADRNEDSKSKLIELIHHRFQNRYIKHVMNIDSGFLMMAVSCLMIETLESFYQGKKNTRGVGLDMFQDFFSREQLLFPNFVAIANDFYSSIRCGILHQAETTNGWRIMRIGNILDTSSKTINAKAFISALEKASINYKEILQKSDFESDIWKNALIKLEDICKNCKAKS